MHCFNNKLRILFSMVFFFAPNYRKRYAQSDKHNDFDVRMVEEGEKPWFLYMSFAAVTRVNKLVGAWETLFVKRNLTNLITL